MIIIILYIILYYNDYRLGYRVESCCRPPRMADADRCCQTRECLPSLCAIRFCNCKMPPSRRPRRLLVCLVPFSRTTNDFRSLQTSFTNIIIYKKSYIKAYTIHKKIKKLIHKLNDFIYFFLGIKK